MAAFQNIGIDGYFKRYGFKYGIKRALFMINDIHIVKDYENKKILYYHKAQKYLFRKYAKYANVDPYGIVFGDQELDNPIWIYWKQGINNAPILVQKCVESVQNNTSGHVIVLDDESVKQYVTLPDDILKKYNSGNISDAALSDLIRFSLLEHFGGTWVDATVYMTSDLPQYIIESDFFAFKDTFGLIKNPALISNWLLHCKKHNTVMRAARNMSFAYWLNEKYVIDYLFTYILLNISLQENEDSVGNYPYANSDYSHLLLDCIDERYDETKMKYINYLAPIKKLTYKLKKETYEKENTFLKYVLGDK